MTRTQDPAKGAQLARWSHRMCFASPPIALAAFVIGAFDDEGGESLLAALALLVAFSAVFFGLVGLFLSAAAKEIHGASPASKWVVRSGVGGIGLAFAAGLFALIT